MINKRKRRQLKKDMTVKRNPQNNIKKCASVVFKKARDQENPEKQTVI